MISQVNLDHPAAENSNFQSKHLFSPALIIGELRWQKKYHPPTENLDYLPEIGGPSGCRSEPAQGRYRPSEWRKPVKMAGLEKNGKINCVQRFGVAF